MADPNYRINFTETHHADDTGREWAQLEAIVLPYEHRITFEVEGGKGYQRRLTVARDLIASKARARRDELDAAAERV